MRTNEELAKRWRAKMSNAAEVLAKIGREYPSLVGSEVPVNAEELLTIPLSLLVDAVAEVLEGRRPNVLALLAGLGTSVLGERVRDLLLSPRTGDALCDALELFDALASLIAQCRTVRPNPRSDDERALCPEHGHFETPLGCDVCVTQRVLYGDASERLAALCEDCRESFDATEGHTCGREVPSSE